MAEGRKSKSLPPKLAIQLVKGAWTFLWRQMVSQMAPSNRAGEYLRPASQFRNAVGGEAGNPYPPEAGRYRLVVGMSCPWAHRTLVVRALKGLESAIPVSLAVPSGDEGIWVFPTEVEGCHTLPELYQRAQPGYRGRCTVPVLWDGKTQTIVNNESSEIAVLLNAQFDGWADNPALDLYPEDLKGAIDAWNEKIYPAVNDGVYRCGFAQTQAAYEKACQVLFSTLDEIDGILAQSPYLCGDRLTLADVRLFTTLIRFDVAYYGLFKCNRRRIKDYPHLGPYVRRLYQLPGVGETCDLEQVKRDYYGNLFPLNPGGIVPIGPDWEELLP